ncbi:MAG: 4Fe-4S dicluster domain-containing protein [Prolixibacteraceae bacterium]|nr:4Fe-4S dicluster domain-containing protein [Prolixibacteraceae bacterium]
MQHIETLIKEKLNSDIRFVEGLNACMNCGICTAICPAAEFYDYDPRTMLTIVQSGNLQKIRELLESDTIWYCGQCMSCKTRCPRHNCPGLVISVLRKISQETGAFTQSRMGRQQYLLRKGLGNALLNIGYSLHPSFIKPADHPEQGPVWQWIFENASEIYKTVGANLDEEGPGVLRKIDKEAMTEFRAIFEETGCLELFRLIDQYSSIKALELGITNEANQPDMDQYLHFIENEQETSY